MLFFFYLIFRRMQKVSNVTSFVRVALKTRKKTQEKVKNLLLTTVKTCSERFGI